MAVVIEDPIADQVLNENWTGFAFRNGYLVTPERRYIEPYQLRWLSLTCTLAREWQKMMEHARAVPLQGGPAASDHQRLIDDAQKTGLRNRTYPDTDIGSVILLSQVLMQRQHKR
ncbi:hypothetical protein FUT69_09305 [Xylella taiwanensis]|uniref:Phage protein n=1 Tax=Xylella taiwanensis TaxID=1444770 RepID=A0ABS8TZG6_9GAMM|nr:DUF3653 domain-containing protein [Xylella taiwanensis]AXI83540.1 hypothetical protein AB672_06130 [Xylella taiwanensis]MCD8456614.1 phage protein [Xylella taiwanensis]MCD8459021.1 phage protein [Xylella taiwanensis]MCD8461160.1 phage protein [Xylella taiwanensis]MCD8462781.1 phage protein [Xylella taiwanensis]